MAEQDLDDPDVGLLFEQVGGVTVPQGVHRDALVDAGQIGCGVNGPIELPCAQLVERIEAGKQPAAIEHLALCPGDPPPDTQAVEEDGREHGVTVLAPLALFDAQGHAIAVDVADLECRHFRSAQASTVGERKCSLMFEVATGGDKAADFFLAQNDRKSLRDAHGTHLGHQLAAINGDVEEKLEPDDGGVQ